MRRQVTQMPAAGSCPSGRGHLSPMRVLVLFFLWHFTLYLLSMDFTVLWADHVKYMEQRKRTTIFLGTGVCVCM